MEKHETEDRSIQCSFCGKSDAYVKRLIAGPNVHICNECVDLCTEIIAEDWHEGMDYSPHAIGTVESEMSVSALRIALRQYDAAARIIVRLKE